MAKLNLLKYLETSLQCRAKKFEFYFLFKRIQILNNIETKIKKPKYKYKQILTEKKKKNQNNIYIYIYKLYFHLFFSSETFNVRTKCQLMLQEL